jgi:ABC-type tungstate transport system permease subunit
MFRSLARLGGLPLGVGLLYGHPARAQTRDMVLATTTSTRDSGLLEGLP